MISRQVSKWSGQAILVAAAATLLGASGCQTNIGGQVLPSAYYLQDDVQYFPAGPEDKLFNERRALEQYKAGLSPEGPPPAAAAPPPPGPPAPAAP